MDQYPKIKIIDGSIEKIEQFMAVGADELVGI
jgi:hypothetical protein